MKYPTEVQECIDILKEYKENKDLNEFNIFHLYQKGLAYPNGYYDSMNFEVVGYNYEKMEFANLGRHDGMEMWDDAIVDNIGMFADGSTYVRFKNPIAVMNTQKLSVIVAK